MTQEEKEILLIDLCARSLYNVMVDYEGHTYVLNEIDPACKDIDYITVRIQDVERLTCAKSVMIENIKPYLYPISSMTEEEFKKLKEYSGLKYEQLDLASYQNGTYKCLDFYLSEVPSYAVILVFDWLNKNHFDYRGLIEKDLALEAPEGMYN